MVQVSWRCSIVVMKPLSRYGWFTRSCDFFGGIGPWRGQDSWLKNSLAIGRKPSYSRYLNRLRIHFSLSILVSFRSVDTVLFRTTHNRIKPDRIYTHSYYFDNCSYLVKPASSKAGNSELYLIMENYSGEMHLLQNSDSFLSNLLETIFIFYVWQLIRFTRKYDIHYRFLILGQLCHLWKFTKSQL